MHDLQIDILAAIVKVLVCVIRPVEVHFDAGGGEGRNVLNRSGC
jgi:hypothetical protein